MKTRKLLVKDNDIAVVVCPSCGQSKNLSIFQYKENRKRELSIKCCCHAFFDICLEFRKHPRLETRLLGKSINLSNHRESKDVIIKNISLGGICLCPFSKNHRTRKDDRLHVFFTLNNLQQTPIESKASVRSVSSDFIGCEFNSTEHFKTALGFYLIS